MARSRLNWGAWSDAVWRPLCFIYRLLKAGCICITFHFRQRGSAGDKGRTAHSTNLPPQRRLRMTISIRRCKDTSSGPHSILLGLVFSIDSAHFSKLRTMSSKLSTQPSCLLLHEGAYNTRHSTQHSLQPRTQHSSRHSTQYIRNLTALNAVCWHLSGEEESTILWSFLNSNSAKSWVRTVVSLLLLLVDLSSQALSPEAKYFIYHLLIMQRIDEILIAIHYSACPLGRGLLLGFDIVAKMNTYPPPLWYLSPYSPTSKEVLKNRWVFAPFITMTASVLCSMDPWFQVLNDLCF